MLRRSLYGNGFWGGVSCLGGLRGGGEGNSRFSCTGSSCRRLALLADTIKVVDCLSDNIDVRNPARSRSAAFSLDNSWLKKTGPLLCKEEVLAGEFPIHVDGLVVTAIVQEHDGTHASWSIAVILETAIHRCGDE